VHVSKVSEYLYLELNVSTYDIGLVLQAMSYTLVEQSIQLGYFSFGFSWIGSALLYISGNFIICGCRFLNVFHALRVEHLPLNIQVDGSWVEIFRSPNYVYDGATSSLEALATLHWI